MSAYKLTYVLINQFLCEIIVISNTSSTWPMCMEASIFLYCFCNMAFSSLAP